MSVANIRETLTCFGFKKQSALQTPLVAADCWSLAKVNAEIGSISYGTENDALDVGKGHEFATDIFRVQKDPSVRLEKYMTSEIAAWALCFGLGKTTKTSPVGGSYRYTCVPLPPVTDGIEMPATTYVETIRQGASAVLDRAMIGMVVQSFGMSFSSGPGRANAKCNIELVGCGKTVEASTITVPAATSEHALNAASMTCTINSIDYVTAKNLLSLEFGWRNNIRLDTGFYPGSGTDDSFAIRGRMEHGDREASLSFVARYENGSTELTKLKALTTGTAVITLTGANISGGTNHDLSITFQKVAFSVAEIGNTDGLVTISVTCLPMYHSSNGLITAYATCAQDNILTAA